MMKNAGTIRTALKKSGAWLACLLAIAMFLPAAVAPVAVSGSTDYQRTITINHSLVSADLSGFPVLINLDSDSGLAAHGSPGYIYFTDQSGNPLPYEIEKFDSASGALVAWVKADLSASVDTILQMKYGGSPATSSGNVWMNGYGAVWHMNQAPPVDSTVNNQTSSDTGAISATSAKFAKGLSFPGSAYVDVTSGKDSTLSFDPAGSYTWDGWLYLTGSISGGAGIVGKKSQTGDPPGGQGYEIYIAGNSSLRFQTTAGSSLQVSSSATIASGAWTHFAVVDNNSNISIYINGALSGSGTISSSADTSNDLYIGYRRSSSSGGYFNGLMDQVTYSTSARPAAWIQTEYNNQNNPAVFAIVAAETNAPAAPQIITQPASQAFNVGSDASFNAAATGNPAAAVKWQVSTDQGANWSDISGAQGLTLSVSAVSPAQNGYQYRAIFTNSEGSATTNAAVLIVNMAPTVVYQPLDQTVTSGGTAIFAAVANGRPYPKTQWQVSADNGATWKNIPLETNPALYLYTTGADPNRYGITAAQNGNQYRAVYSNGVGTATSAPATLTVNSSAPADNVAPQAGTEAFSNSVDTSTAPYTVHLSWGAATDNTGVTQYRVCLNDGVIATISETQFDYVLPTLNTDSYYFFKVLAGDAAGNWSADYIMGGGTEGPVLTRGYQVYDGLPGGTATAAQWNTPEITGWLRAYNVGTAAKPDTLFKWSQPVGGDYAGLVWGYTVLSDYTTPPHMHIDSVNSGDQYLSIGDQNGYADYANRGYLWTTDNTRLHIGGYGEYNAWPEANKDYYFSMMARNWGDILDVKGPVVHFDTAWDPMMYAASAGYQTTITQPASKVNYVEGSGNGRQTVYNIVNNPVDPQNAWFEFARSGSSGAGWSVAPGAVDPHFVLIDKESGAVIPLTPNLSAADNSATANNWDATKGTFYGYTDNGNEYFQVHVSYSGAATSAVTLESNHTYVLSLNGPWDSLYIPNNYTYAWEFTTAAADKIAPSWPAGAALATSAVTPTTVTLSWPAATDDVGVTAYNIYRDGSLVTQLKGDRTAYTDVNLVPGSTQNWSITAQDYLGNTSASLTAGPLNTPLDSAPPTWPGGSALSAGNIQAAALDLTWNAAQDDYPVTAYRVYQGEALIATLAGNVLTYQVTGLAPAQPYTFTVQAGDESGNWSTNGPSVNAATIADTVAPTWPNGATPTVTNVSGTTLTLSWPAAADNYKVDYYEVLANGSLAASVTAPVVSTTLTGLLATTSYDLQVVAVDPAGNRTPGAIINQTTTSALETAFSADKTSGTAPLTVHFSDQSSNSPLTWNWDFNNDGTVDSTDQNPTYTYDLPGVYSVKLASANADGGNELIKSGYITVTGSPVAAFTADFTSGLAPLTVQFTDQSSLTPTAWAWDFNNDGTVDSGLQNPTYTFTASGTYSVKLIASNSAGNSLLIKTNYISVTQPGVPVAAFSANLTSGYAPLTVQFTDQSSNTPTSWAWDFNNDGTPDSTLRNPVYTYSNPGIYSVKLTVANAGGNDNELKTAYISVSASVAPVAAFSADKTSGTAPLTVNFSDQSINTPAVWAWDFNNDGTVDSNAQNPSYTFTGAGTYSVKLTVSNLAGSDDEIKSAYITAGNPWYVDASGAAGFTTIQAAINAAQAGDTILVKDGTYQENINVNKRLTLRSENQYGATVTFLAFDKSIFSVSADNVVIDGFNISGNATYTWLGIDGAASYGSFINNRISGVNTGIRLGNYSLAANNTITSNGHGDIYQYVMYNVGCGVLLMNGSHGNTVTNNTCTSTNGASIGVLVFTVSGATGGDGQTPINSQNNTISGNTCSGNQYGIFVQQSMYNTFYGNTLTNNQYGLYLRQNGTYTATTGNVFYFNTVSGNTLANLAFLADGGASESQCNLNNTWNSSAPVIYGYNGSTHSGYVGNFWGNYSGSDADGNGIGESPYLTQSAAGEYDHYPLMAAISNYVLGGSASPLADFTASTRVGMAPLTVYFSNTSSGAEPLTYDWDCDNDGTLDSTLPNATFTYTHPGLYSVRLTVTNANGSNQTVKTALIRVKSTSEPWYVGPAGSGAEFGTIQSAINNTAAGGTIVVWDGNYSESPVIAKALTIRSENGHQAVHVAGSFSITANNVTLDGFSISGAITYSGPLYGNSAGSHDTIANNDVAGGPISLSYSSYTSVLNNRSLGLYMYDSYSSTVSGNTFHDAAKGIQLFQCGADWAGGNIFTNNVCLNNQYGLYLTNSMGNTFYLNSVIGSATADFYNDQFHGVCAFSSAAPVSYLYDDDSLTGIMGNYWGHYSGTDANQDGFGDTPYALNATNGGAQADSYPLMFPASAYSQTVQSPAATFTADGQSGVGKLTVKFSNNSTGSAPLVYDWNFGDGSAHSSLANPVHAYTAGVYTVTLRVSCFAGNDSSTRTSYITVTGILGDVNADGGVNIQDVILTVNFALGKTVPSADQFRLADYNADGTINVLDIILIVNKALGR
jgi:parallel beta-helix repeat protein